MCMARGVAHTCWVRGTEHPTRALVHCFGKEKCIGKEKWRSMRNLAGAKRPRIRSRWGKNIPAISRHRGGGEGCGTFEVKASFLLSWDLVMALISDDLPEFDRPEKATSCG